MAAPTLVATVASASANSYLTVAAAVTYFNGRLNTSAWDDAYAADVGDCERALIMATRRIDEEKFKGQPVNPLTDVYVGTGVTTQALKWPRYSTTDDAGWTYDYDEIPLCIQRATAELALYYLNQGTTDPLQQTGLEGFQHIAIGPLDVTPVPGYASSDLPDAVREILRPVLYGAGTGFRVVRT